MANDMTILGGIIFFFFAVSLLATFINASFGSSLPENNIEAIKDNVETSARSDQLSIWTVIFDIIKMFFWTFGNIPAWLDLTLFVPIRIIFFFTLVRNAWIGGGS